MNKITAYFRTFALDQTEAMSDVQEFIDDYPLEDTEIIGVYHETDNDLEEINKKIKEYLLEQISFEEATTPVVDVEDLEGLRKWTNASICLEGNEIEKVSEFRVEEHAMDLENIKVIPINFHSTLDMFIVAVEVYDK